MIHQNDVEVPESAAYPLGVKASILLLMREQEEEDKMASGAFPEGLPIGWCIFSLARFSRSHIISALVDLYNHGHIYFNTYTTAEGISATCRFREEQYPLSFDDEERKKIWIQVHRWALSVRA